MTKKINLARKLVKQLIARNKEDYTSGKITADEGARTEERLETLDKALKRK